MEESVIISIAVSLEREREREREREIWRGEEGLEMNGRKFILKNASLT